MNIAYITDQWLPQTATDTEQLVNMASAFGQAGADVTLITPSHWFKQDADLQEVAGYYQVTPDFRLQTVRGTMPFIRGIEKIGHAYISSLLLNDQQYDAVYSRNLPAIVTGLMNTSIHIFYETYRPWPDQKVQARPFFRWLNTRQQFGGIILHSKLAARSYQQIGYPDKKLLTAHNGIDPTQFKPRLAVTEARNQLSIDSDPLTVTYAGRVSEDKGLHMLLTLARQFPEVRFMIIGSEGRGPIEKQAEEIPNVLVYKWQPKEKLPVFLYASDILFIPPTVKPLYTKGNTVLPMKTFVYMGSGRAILAPQSEDIMEVLTHDENAWLVEADNQTALHTAFKQLVEDPELRKRLARKARKDVDAMTWENRAEKILAFIDSNLS